MKIYGIADLLGSPEFKEFQLVTPTIDSMRAKIEEKYSSCPVVRRVFDTARSQGVSEDSAMVMLAFYAIQMYEESQKKLAEEIEAMRICPCMHVDPAEKGGDSSAIAYSRAGKIWPVK